jgi:hypothetical protein
MRREMAVWRATGAESTRPYYLALLVEAAGEAEAPEKGLTALAEHFAEVNSRARRVFEAELYRLQGELLLRKTSRDQFGVCSPESNVTHPRPLTPNPQAEAETCFQTALEIARRQQAKALELRAAMSLARLWQQQGKNAEACQLMEEIYGWFTEGFHTPDLQEAEALLRALGGTAPGTQPPRPRGSLPSQDSTLRTQLPAVFRKEGEYWTLAFQGSVCRLKDSRGLHYLALLLQHPNEELPALQLVLGAVMPDAAQPSALSGGGISDLVDPEEKPLSGFSDAGEIIDQQARAAYKQRLYDLQAEVAEAQAGNDTNRVDQLQDEIEFLTRELSHAIGLGGRVRKAGSATERARVNVTKALKSTINKISKNHPALGRYLAQTIRTGTYSSYTPDPHLPISWQT